MLVVANSARFIAQMAWGNGFRVVAVDLFADSDTAHYCVANYRVCSLAITDLQPVIERLTARYAIQACLYGSGFEIHIPSLYYLAKQFSLHGNAPHVFQNTLDKRALFSVLQQLNIPYPTVSWQIPKTNHASWLSKPLQGFGGMNICYCQLEENSTGRYWQKYQTGAVYSVLFLASAQHCQPIGFHSQWSHYLNEQQAFLFSGIGNFTDLPTSAQEQVQQWLTPLAEQFQLRGLNSLDFIYDGQQCYFLEINARLSASVQLYDKSLLLAHFGQPFITPTHHNFCAYKVIYSPATLLIESTLDWPLTCVDRPVAGSTCQAGEVLCGMMVNAVSIDSLQNELYSQQSYLFSQFLEVFFNDKHSEH